MKTSSESWGCSAWRNLCGYLRAPTGPTRELGMFIGVFEKRVMALDWNKY